MYRSLFIEKIVFEVESFNLKMISAIVSMFSAITQSIAAMQAPEATELELDDVLQNSMIIKHLRQIGATSGQSTRKFEDLWPF